MLLQVPRFVFPACAGVIRYEEFVDKFKPSFPRMRGGDPRLRSGVDELLQFSPHARG